MVSLVPTTTYADDTVRRCATTAAQHSTEELEHEPPSLARVALTDASAVEAAGLPVESPSCIVSRSRYAPRDPDISPTWVWIAAQLLPSPQFIANPGGDTPGLDPYAFGLRWQLTPLLVSWSVREGLSRLRWFIVEPVVRHAGSFELFFSPELLFQRHDVLRNVLVRGGARFYMPLYHAGEYFSMSLGSSYYWIDDTHGASFEAGIYVLFGGLGLVTTWSPWLQRAEWITTLNLRVF